MSTTYPDLTYTTFPDQEQSFVEMKDITDGDAVALTNYQNAMKQGDFQAAQQALSSMTNANNKLINAVKLNTLFDTCVALERFYQTNIKPYIEEKQQEWEAIIDVFTDNFAYIGAWNNTTEYKRNNYVSLYNIVTNNTYLYIALQDNTGEDLSNTVYWRPLTIEGSQGNSGTGVAFQASWSASQSYTTGDIVAHKGELWQATQDNTNQEPAQGSQYWSSFGAFQFTNIYVDMNYPMNLIPGDFWFQVL